MVQQHKDYVRQRFFDRDIESGKGLESLAIATNACILYGRLVTLWKPSAAALDCDASEGDKSQWATAAQAICVICNAADVYREVQVERCNGDVLKAGFSENQVAWMTAIQELELKVEEMIRKRVAVLPSVFLKDPQHANSAEYPVNLEALFYGGVTNTVGIAVPGYANIIVPGS